MSEDANQWAVWLEEHGPALVLLARQWVKCRADAEDIVQEGFLRFWRSRQKVADPTAYLFACVRRCAFEWLRGLTRRTRREQAAARPETVPDAQLLSSSLEQEERRTAIESALGCLPVEQREALVLKIWGGLTFPQIAAALAVSANTAASRYRYALAKLREQLTEETIP
jgi:RNA polymerase sigma-70 factor (ECF subfamily)